MLNHIFWVFSAAVESLSVEQWKFNSYFLLLKKSSDLWFLNIQLSVHFHHFEFDFVLLFKKIKEECQKLDNEFSSVSWEIEISYKIWSVICYSYQKYKISEILLKIMKINHQTFFWIFFIKSELTTNFSRDLCSCAVIAVDCN